MTIHSSPSAASVISNIVKHLREHGSSEHAAGVQWFFKEEVQSPGWYTAELRRYARTLHKQLAADQPLLLDVAERLFASPFLEEKALAVTGRLLAERDNMVQKGPGWLLREWAKHDPGAAVRLAGSEPAARDRAPRPGPRNYPSARTEGTNWRTLRREFLYRQRHSDHRPEPRAAARSSPPPSMNTCNHDQPVTPSRWHRDSGSRIWSGPAPALPGMRRHQARGLQPA